MARQVTTFNSACYPCVALEKIFRVIQNQRCVRTILFDGRNIGPSKVAGSPGDLRPLVFAELGLKETINSVFSLAFSGPNNAASIKVIDNRDELSPLLIGNLINTYCFQASYFMIRPLPSDHTMDDV